MSMILQRNYNKKILWIVISTCLAGFAYGQPGSGQLLGLPFSKYISSSEYNSGMLNSSITQDKRGFMYLANNFGLLEFDGNKWKTYPVRDGSKVRDLAITSSGRIYVAAQGDFGFFMPDEVGDLSYFSLSSSLPEENRNFDEVWNVFIGKDHIYFCTRNTIFVYNDIKFVTAIPIDPSTRFFYLRNRVYYQAENGALFSLKNKLIEKIIPPEQLAGIGVVSILPVPDNRFMMLTSNDGIYDIMANRYNTALNNDEDIRNAKISCALRLSNGNIAIGTENNGIYIYSDIGRQIINMTKGSGLENRSVYTMFEDKQGNLWLGHNNGVSLIELSIPFSYLNEDSGLPGSGYDAFNSGDDLYLATNNGLFRGSLSNPDLNLTSIRNTEGQSYYINEFKNNILLGHHSGGYRIKGNEALRLNDGTGTWTFLSSPSSTGNLISGTYNGLQLYRSEDSSWIFLTDIQGLEESSRVMEYDEYGDIWMTHGYKGVYRLQLNRKQDSLVSVEYYGADDGLPSQALVNVYKIEDELIFTTTDGPYIFDYTSNSFIADPILSEYSVLKTTLNFMVNDAKLNIYFLTQTEIGILLKQTDGSYEPDLDIFNKLIPFLNDDLEGISIINSNNVLFGAKEGFIVYHPLANKPVSDDIFNTYVRTVTISSQSDSTIFAGNFSRDDQIIFEQEKEFAPSLPFKYNSVNFTFSANFMNDFDQTMYQYILEGFEDRWSTWHTQAEAGYTNLRKGDYTLRVKAKDIYNHESSETSYSFSILSPWYLSQLAYVAYLSLFLASFFLIFRYIDRRYRKSKKDFELIKQSEVDEISGKLDSLTQEKKEEIERLQSDKHQTEIGHKNAELASSTMNLINKNIFIAQIKSNLTSISKKSKSDEVKDELSRIKKEIDKNISNDEDWDQFTFHFNRVHGDFSRRLTSDFENLSAQDLRLSSYLRLNLSTKEIAHLLNISVRGVEISRYRLRKKLKLERNENLAEFILNY
ncbi:MAG: triple tyrosine motif-containing protein [Bacteroidales bacterium]|nr:triple tyrosine motif-containing protein [Bacteroidales bacterium]